MENNVLLITDILIYLIIGLIVILIIEKEGKELKIKKKIVVKEMQEGVIEKVIRTIVGERGKYMIIFKTILMFILIYNIIGLVPYNKTITSELILTMTLSISLLIGITIIGVERSGVRILKILVPQNTPLILVPLLVSIETISYIARGLSLGLRLGANMIAGHTLLKIIITFIYTLISMDINKYIEITWNNKILKTYKEKLNIWETILGEKEEIKDKKEIRSMLKEKESSININYGIIIKVVITILPIIGLILIIMLEIGVGIMQALVFVIITGIYINDVDNEIKSYKSNSLEEVRSSSEGRGAVAPKDKDNFKEIRRNGIWEGAGLMGKKLVGTLKSAGSLFPHALTTAGFYYTFKELNLYSKYKSRQMVIDTFNNPEAIKVIGQNKSIQDSFIEISKTIINDNEIKAPYEGVNTVIEEIENIYNTALGLPGWKLILIGLIISILYIIYTLLWLKLAPYMEDYLNKKLIKHKNNIESKETYKKIYSKIIILLIERQLYLIKINYKINKLILFLQIGYMILTGIASIILLIYFIIVY